MTATLKHQSKAIVLSDKLQGELLEQWDSESDPRYLIRDREQNILRVYASLPRARNWCKGTGRIIEYNGAAKALLDIEPGAQVFRVPASKR